MEVGRKQKVGLNLQLHRMVVKIVLGLVYLPQRVLAITNADQAPRPTQDIQARATATQGGQVQAGVVEINQVQLQNLFVKTVQAMIL